MAESNGGSARFYSAIHLGIGVSLKLHAARNGFPKEIPDLLDMAESILNYSISEGGFKIYCEPKDYNAKTALGRMQGYGGSFRIEYDIKQNICWRRFIVAKEVCQCLYAFDSADQMRTVDNKHETNTPEQIEQLLTELMAGVTLVGLSHAANSEANTKLMALEILLPHHQRSAVDAELKSGKTNLDIAKAYRLPERWVEVFLNPSYKKLMDHCYSDLGLTV